MHHTDALSRESPSAALRHLPQGEKTSLILWGRQHKTVLSGFMGISSVGYAATFPSGEGFYSPLRWREGTAAERYFKAICFEMREAIAVGEIHLTDALSWGSYSPLPLCGFSPEGRSGFSRPMGQTA